MAQIITNDVVADFVQQLPQPPVGTNEQHRQKAQGYANMIFRSRATITIAAQIYGAHLSIAWNHWDEAERAVVLRRADAKIPERKRPDFEGLKPDNQFAGLDTANRSRKQRKSALMPHINVEQLVKGDHALMLIHGRAGLNPFDYAFAELEHAHANRTRARSMSPAEPYSLFVLNRQKLLDYGVVGPRGSQDSIDLPLSEGLLMLEVQANLYLFVEQLVIKILAAIGIDYDEDAASRLEPNPIVQPNPTDESLAAVMSRAPYRTANSFEPNELLHTVNLYAAESHDHLVELLANPEYLLDAVANSTSQSALRLAIEKNQLSSEGAIQQTDDEDSVTHTRLMMDAGEDLYNWGIIQKLLTDLLPLFPKVDEKQAERDIPAYMKFLKLFADLDHALEEMLDALIRRFEQSVSCMPSLLDICDNAPKLNSKAKRWSLVEARLKIDGTPELSYIFQLCRMICEPALRTQNGLYNLVDALGDAMKVDGDDTKQYVTSAVMHDFSQLYLVTAIHHEVELFQPQCTQWRMQFLQTKECQVNKGAMSLTKTMLMDCIKEFTLQHGFDGMDDRLSYPEPDSSENQQQRQRARETLIGFWDGLAAKVKSVGQSTSNTNRVNRLAKGLPVTAKYGIGSYHLLESFDHLSRSRKFYTEQTAKLDRPRTAALPKAQTLTLQGSQRSEAPKPLRKTGQIIPSSLGALAQPSAASTVTKATSSKAPVSQSQHTSELSYRPASFGEGSSLTSDAPRRFQSTQDAPKPRRRNNQDRPGEAEEAVNNAEAEEERPIEQIVLDSRSFAVFDYILSLTRIQAGGQIVWTEVRYAMAQAGFSERATGRGSAREFRRGDLRITAHRPHPDPAWVRVQAREFGSRLRRKLDDAGIEIVEED